MEFNPKSMEFWLSVMIVVLLDYTSSLDEFDTSPPHIIILLADDLGWGDVSWNNRHVISPALDEYVSEGLVLNQSYVLNSCTPSRHALLTGRYPFRDGLQHDPFRDPRPTCMPLDVRTLPEKLKELGYATHLIGKWHLGFCHENCLPHNRGFNSFYGFLGGYIDHVKLDREGGLDFWDNDVLVNNTEVADKYAAELFLERAQHIVKNHDRKQPLFLLMSLDLPHTPLQVPRWYEERYSHVSNRQRRKYLGMLTMMDDIIGNFSKTLKEESFWNDAIVIFMSDNGAQAKYGGSNYPLRGAKMSLYEGGVRSPTVLTGGRVVRRGTTNELFHIVDWYHTLISLAGGTLALQNGATKEAVDSLDQSSLIISLDETPPIRTEFIYNLDTHSYQVNPLAGHGAIRYGDYKLIWGFPGVGDLHYPHPWLKPAEMCEFCEAKQTDCSTECRTVETNGLSYEQVLQMVSPVLEENRLDRSIKLFNIIVDPWEKHDISLEMHELVELLKAKMIDHMKQEAQPMLPLNNPSFSALRQDSGKLPIGWCSLEYLQIQTDVSRAASSLPRHFYQKY